MYDFNVFSFMTTHNVDTRVLKYGSLRRRRNNRLTTDANINNIFSVDSI